MLTPRLLLLFLLPFSLAATMVTGESRADPPQPVPAAILPFHDRSNPVRPPLIREGDRPILREPIRTIPLDNGNPPEDGSRAREPKEQTDKNIAAMVVDLLTVKMLASEHVMLVERQEIERIMDELKLSRTGLVKADEAAQVGKLTGAKLLITGSVFKVDNDLYLIAKVVGTETSRLAGASVKGPANSDLGELVDKLASELDIVIGKKVETLLPKIESEVDWIASLKNQIAGKKLSAVTVNFQPPSAEGLVGTPPFLFSDTKAPGKPSVPLSLSKSGSASKLELAARTEMERLLKEVGFEVISSDHPNSKRADIAIVGESKSEFAFRRGDWITMRCRIDVQVRSQSEGKVLASDSETIMVCDLTEQLAAAAGLQDGIRKVARRLVPKLVE